MMNRQLSAAILGLGEKAIQLLETAGKSGLFKILAVADLDKSRAEKIASQYNCSPYDDYRQLVMQNNFDCLLITEALHNCHQHLNAAIQKKISILKLAPPARNFAEASSLAKTADENNIIFSVAAPWRLCPDYLKLLSSMEKPEEKPLLVTAACSYTYNNLPVWHNDPVLAGGGVLLMDCYGLIDQLIRVFGLPEQVYSVTTNAAADRQQKLALTENIAVVIMRFADNFCINLAASRNCAENQQNQTLGICYKDRIEQKKKFSLNPESFMPYVLAAFANSCLDPQNSKPISPINDHLANMAVIEAAYLSAKTRMPEEPARILSLAR